jgi:hypothetical protein
MHLIKSGIYGLAGFASLTLAFASDPQAPVEISFIHVQFSDSDLDGGGELGSSQTNLQIGTEWSKGRGEAFGVSFGVGLNDYDLSGSTVIPGSAAWGQVTGLDLGVNWRRPVGRSGMFFIAPNLAAARGEGADWGESLEFGLIASYGYRVSSTLTFGIGAGIFTGLEETSGFPVLLIDWRISENWRVGNSFRAGPSGPAGIELAYSPDPGWEVAVGGGWRSERFRLDENGPVPDGIGEVEGAPIYLRVSWDASEQLSVDLFGGIYVGGEVLTETSGGFELARDDLDATPFFGLSANSRF